MRKLTILLFLTILSFPMAAAEWGYSVFPWSFVGGDYQGAFVGAGVNVGLSPRLEAEILGVAQVTPAPVNVLLGGITLGYNLFGDRIPTYFNGVLELGYLHGVKGLTNQDSLEHSNFLMLRLSPLALGNPYYGERDRVFSLGLLYRLEDQAFSMVWNWVIFGRY